MKKYYGAIILAIWIIACGSQSNKDPAVERDLTIFENLAMAEAGLDFPPSKDHLETCRRVEDIPCLQSFKVFNEAKARLQQMPRGDALDLTLEGLGEACIVNVPARSKVACFGAVMALYFFPEESEDLKIRHFLSQLPQSTRDNVLDRSASSNLCWLENRPDETAWRSWLESKLMDASLRSRAIHRLEKPAPPSDPLQEFPYHADGK